MQTIPLAVIANRWAEAVKDNQKITDYCMKHFGKDLGIYIGYDEASAPLEEDRKSVV